jgi:protein TonB
MFEENMVESIALPISPVKRWTMAGSIILQTLLALGLITIPLFHPERLRFQISSPIVFTPIPPRPPIRVRQQPRVSEQEFASSLPLSGNRQMPVIGENRGRGVEVPPNLMDTKPGWGEALPAILAMDSTRGTTVSVARSNPAVPRLRVSNGVSAGVIITPIRPIYPAIARAAGISGKVIVEAIISRAGTIESLRIVSGPPLLREAALAAIRAARYRPYLLNGEPTEVETTISVNFTLSG